MDADTRNTSRPMGGGGAGSPPCPTTGPPTTNQAEPTAEARPYTKTPQARSNDALSDVPKPTLSQFGQRALALVGEYKEYVSYYLGARFDGIKVSLRNVGIYAVLGIVGLIALSAAVTTAVALLLVGSAWGLGVLFRGDHGPRIWLGALIVGLVVLGALAGGAVFGMKMLTNTFRKAMVNKYEQRKRWQRGQFGRNVDDAAATAPAP